MDWKTAGAPRRAEAKSPLPSADKFLQIADGAFDTAQESGLRGVTDGPQDAYRHAVWNGRMAREYGPTVARAVGVAHEITGVGMSLLKDGKANLAASAMDLKNNERGIQAAMESKDEADMERRLRGMGDRSRELKTYSEAWDALFADELVNLPANEKGRYSQK